MEPLGRNPVGPGQLRNAAFAVAGRAIRPYSVARRLQEEALAYKGDTRRFRGEYAKAFRWLLTGQLLLTNSIFLAVGIHWLAYDPVTLRIFIGATIGEIVALVMIVVRHLFPLQ